MPSAEEEKRVLRKRMKLLRQQLAPLEKARMDKRLEELFLELPEIREARTVFCYVSYGTETDTSGLIRRLLECGKAVAVPRVEKEQIVFYHITGAGQLTAGYRGIQEPCDGAGRADDRDAPVLTPGLAFTRSGKRLGYGGGFYDRFFEREPEHRRIALAYPFQIVEEIPEDGFDRRVHQILIPERVTETGGYGHGFDADRYAGEGGCGIPESFGSNQEK